MCVLLYTYFMYIFIFTNSNMEFFDFLNEIWGLWAGTESLACLIRRDGEEGHDVGNNYGCSW